METMELLIRLIPVLVLLIVTLIVAKNHYWTTGSGYWSKHQKQ